MQAAVLLTGPKISLIFITEPYIDSYDQCFCHTGAFSHLCLLSAEDWWEKMKRNTTVAILSRFDNL